MPLRYELDVIDIDILSYLLADAQLPYTVIADKIGTSTGTVHVRMKKMMEAGVVAGSQLVVNSSALGFDVCAFLGIYLEKGSMYKQVSRELEKISEIVELHYTTGNYNILAKIVCRDTAHLREVLNEKVQAIEGVERTETLISLDSSLNRPIDLTTRVVYENYPKTDE